MNNREPFDNIKDFTLCNQQGASIDPDNGALVQYVYWNEDAVKQANKLNYRDDLDQLKSDLKNCNNDDRIASIKGAISNVLYNNPKTPAIFNKPDYIKEAEDIYEHNRLMAIKSIKLLCDNYSIKLNVDFIKRFEAIYQTILGGYALDEVLAIPQNEQPQQKQIDNTGKEKQTNTKCESNFLDYIVPGVKRDNILKNLHRLIDGKKGKAVAYTLAKAKIEGFLTEAPPYAAVVAEFGDIGAPSGYNKHKTEQYKKEHEKYNIGDLEA